MAPRGRDGFLAEFYQNFGKVIKTKMLEFFYCLQTGHLDLFRLNFGEIILSAVQIQQYRLICLLNVSLKITKMATIRLNSFADHVVRLSQSAFMQGRNILDCVVILHETVHELHMKNRIVCR